MTKGEISSTERRRFHNLFGTARELTGPLATSGAGRKIRGLDLSEPLTPQQVEFLLDSLATHRLLTIAGQDLDYFNLQQFERFACHWGAPVPHPSNFLRDGRIGTAQGRTDGAIEYMPMSARVAANVNKRFPEQISCLIHESPAVLVVTNFGGEPPPPHKPSTPTIRPGGSWHTDIEYETEPIYVSMFLIHHVPTQRDSDTNTWLTPGAASTAMAKVRLNGSGEALVARRQELPLNGETAYADTTAAFEALPKKQQDFLKRVRVRRRLNEEDPGWLTPLVRTNPRSGNHSLHSPIWSSRPGIRPAIEVDGLSAEESREFLDELEYQVLDESFRHVHAHTPGDVTIWDNYQTLHTSPPMKSNINSIKDARLFYRISCKGQPSVKLPRHDDDAWIATHIPGGYVSPLGIA